MKNSWIHVHEGKTARQARVGVADLNEEHYSRGGFFGPVSMLYHGRKPADPLRVEGPISIAVALLGAMTFNDEDNPSGLPTEMLVNDELSISLSRRSSATPHLLRNVDADTLYFIHEGEGVIATEFGPIDYEPEDLILIPKGTTYRHMPSTPTTAEGGRVDRADRVHRASADRSTLADRLRRARHPEGHRLRLARAGRVGTQAQARSRNHALRSTPSCRSISSGGRATCSRSSSTSATSGRSPRNASTSRRRRGRSSNRPVSCACRSCRCRWSAIPKPRNCRPGTAMSTPTR